MLGRWKKGGCLLALLVLGACSDQSNEAPTGPQFKPGGGGSSTSCDFGSLQTFIVGYFPGNQQSGIFSLRNSMESETDAAARRAIGYQIMDSIGKTSRTTSLSSSALTAGSNLTKGLIKCMFDASIKSEFPGFPDSSLYSFDLALNAPAGGAYYVRPEADASGSSPAIATLTGTDPIGNLSGVAPPIDSTWGDLLNEKVLIYGWPTFTDPLNPLNNEFEWALIRPNAIFDPGAVIALCVGDVPSNTLIAESNIGLLSWEGSGGYICGTSRPLVMLESGWDPRSLARRMMRWGTGLLAPQPAFAAALLSGGTGTAKTLKSKLSLGAANGISLDLLSGPKAVERVNVPFTIRLRATTSDGDGVNGICIILTGFANNGQVAQLLGLNNCDNPNPKQLARATDTEFVDAAGAPCLPGSGPNCKPQAGYVTFDVTVPSPGAMNISITDDLTDSNLNQEIADLSTGKFNIKP